MFFPWILRSCSSPHFQTVWNEILIIFCEFVCYCRCTLQFFSFFSFYVKSIQASQCGNCGNTLSYLLDKNFVKLTFLLKKLLKSWFHDFFSLRENFSFFHTVGFDCERYPKFYVKRLQVQNTQCGNFGNFPPLQNFFVKLIYSRTL